MSEKTDKNDCWHFGSGECYDCPDFYRCYGYDNYFLINTAQGIPFTSLGLKVP